MKRSKLLSILLAVMMILSTMSCLSVVSLAANLVDYGYTQDTVNEEDSEKKVVAWEFYDDGVLKLYADAGSPEWAEYNNKITTVELTAKNSDEECMVTTIPGQAFYGCDKLTSVDMAGGKVTSIGAYAFNECTALTEIDIPNSVVSIGDYAFYGCTALTKAELSYSLREVGKNVFKGCTALKVVDVPNGVLKIGYGMFENCAALATIDLPDSVMLIGEHAFEGCSSLTKIDVPDSVEEIGSYAFYESGVVNAYIGHMVSKVGEYVFGRCASLESVEFTSSIDVISDWMFYGCTALTTIVDFPESVNVIGAHAFEGCSALTELAVPNTVISIGDSAFAGCTGLADVTLSTALETIGANAFKGTSISTIDIPYNVNKIGSGAFAGCSSLTAINVEYTNNTYRSVDGVVYTADMTKLVICPAGKTGDVVIPESVTEIGSNAFIGCTGITSVTIPASVETIDANAFNGCGDALVIKTGCSTVAATYAKIHSINADITHSDKADWIVIEDATCETAGTKEKKCADCNNEVIDTAIINPLGHNYDTGVVTKNATCEDDGVVTFTCQNVGCGISYTEVIPATGHNIDDGTIVVEPTCEAEGIKRFRCKNDGCYYYYDFTLAATGHNMDDGNVTVKATCESDGTIVYKCKDDGCGYSYEAVISATGHKYGAVENVLAPTCEDDGYSVQKCTNDGCEAILTTIISATGHNYDTGIITKYPTVNELGEITYTCQNKWCEEDHANHTHIVYIPNSAFTGILDANKDAYADENGNIQNLKWLITDTYDLYVFADDTTEEWVGYKPFIVTATFAGDTTTVENGSLAKAPELTTVNVLLNLGTIEAYAFQQCPKLETVVTGSIKKIENFAFHDCDALEYVEIYGGLAEGEVGENIFYRCDNLSTVILGNGCLEIGYAMFMDCAALTEITLPESLVVIGDSAFDGTSLKTINIPKDVEVIEKGVFTNCNTLTSIDVDDKNDFYFSVGGALYDIRLNTLMLCPAGKAGEVVVWDGATEIADDAFIGCKKVTKVNIPNSVMKIGANAFNNCATNLVIKGDCDSQGITFAKARGIATDITHVASSAWQIIKPATCLENGSENLVCTGCGFVYETREITALDHNYDNGVVTKAATCDADGVMTFTCTRTDCSESYTEVIPALKHKYNTGEVIQAATCTENGTMRYSCQNDGCLSYYDEVIEKTGHNMDDGTITVAATCETDGEKVYKCQNAGCLHKTTEVIPATGHSYDKGVVTKAATCTEDGVKTFTCQNCELTYTEKVDAIGHNYIAVEVKKATCLEDGKIQHTCANCGDFYTEVTKGAHVPYSAPVKVEPTCTQAGKEGAMCAVCRQFIGNVKEIPATGHTYVNGTCSGCGDKTNDSQKPSTKPGSTVVTPESSGSSNNSTAKVPATPKLLLLKNKNEGLVLTWKAVDGATGYRVYRRAAGAKSWTYLGTVKECTYLDKAASTGQYWRYTVRAVNDAGFSGFENGIYIKRVATPHVASIANTPNGVKVTWAAISNAKTYKVYRRGAGETWKCIATVTGTSFVDTAVKSGSYYRYTVRAVDGYYSAYESGLLIKFVAAPHLTGVSNTSNGVRVNWNAVDGADSYRVYRRAAGKSWTYVTTVTGTSYVDTAVKGASGYYRYTVRAVDGAYSGYEAGLVIKK